MILLDVTITSKEMITKTTARFVLSLPFNYHDVKPGQFIKIDSSESGDILSIPISICNAIKRAGQHKMVIVVEDRGPATKWLVNQNPGKTIKISKPKGNGFDIDPGKKYLVVGGGIGVPPLLLAAMQNKVKPTDALLCFTTKEKVMLEEDFKHGAGEVFVATDDGSYGDFEGRADKILRGALKSFGPNYYGGILACGPKKMLAAIAKIAEEFGIPCQVSLEERMACGKSVCKGCAVQLTDGSMVTVCGDGPVFNSKVVKWDAA